MNELERALQNPVNTELDFYLEITPTAGVRNDINEIKRKAADAIDATSRLAAIREILSENTQSPPTR